MTRFDCWLDRVALGVATRFDGVASSPTEPVGARRAEGGVSRSAAIRTIAGGVLMLAAPALIAAAPAEAEDTECKDSCQDEFRHAQAKRLNKCTGLFNGYNPSKSVDLLFKSPWASTGLSTLCYGIATQITRDELLDCKTSCDKTGKPTKPKPACGASSRNSQCYAPPQPPRLTPAEAPPPPPADTSSQCQNCTNVGGYCLTCSNGDFYCGTPGVQPSTYCPGG